MSMNSDVCLCVYRERDIYRDPEKECVYVSNWETQIEWDEKHLGLLVVVPVLVEAITEFEFVEAINSIPFSSQRKASPQEPAEGTMFRGSQNSEEAHPAIHLLVFDNR